MNDTDKVYLLDASTYIHRAYHAIPDLTTSGGFPTNALFGFAQTLQALLDAESPAYVAAVFDSRGPTFRHSIYPEYKANRPPLPESLAVQLPHCRRIVEAFRLPAFELAGYEADDIIASLTAQARAAGLEVMVVSADKDLMQLVGPGVWIYDPIKGQRLGEAEVLAKFGVPPQQVVEVQGLMGDSVDNIPGVRGIGPKGAADLIQAYGTLDALYAHLDEIPGKRRELLAASRPAAFLSRQLATLARDVPLALNAAALRRGPPDADRLHALFREFEFRRLAERYVPQSEASGYAYETVWSEADLASMVGHLAAGAALAFDLETTSLDPVRAAIVGLSFAADERRAFYVPVAHEGLDVPPQLPLAQVLGALGPLLEDPHRPKYGQNHKYDDVILLRHGVDVRGVTCDPMIASYLLDPDARRHSLDALAADHLGVKTIHYEDVAGKGSQQKPFAHVPVPQATEYSCEDAHLTFRLATRLMPHVEAAGLGGLMREVEIPLARVLARMELAGVLVDRRRLYEIGRALGERMTQLEHEVWQAAGSRFNPGSPKQLQTVLFETLGLRPKRRIKTGFSTDSAVLEQLVDDHPVVPLLLAWRAMAKLKSTYADALPALIHPDTGRIHTSFNLAVAATGRLSSSDPNLQNIPVRTAEGRQIRTAFVAPPGHVLLSADYSQIELRVLAHLSEDPGLLGAFAQGTDIHAQTAAEVFGVAPEAVTKEQRAAAKTINFGMVYGMGPQRLARTLDIPRAEAQGIIDRYFERYPGIHAYFDDTLERARRTGEVRTVLGRRRLVPDLQSGSPVARAAAERTAINTPVQGSAADIMKLAMLNLDRALTESALPARMLLQVHDELVLEVAEDALPAVQALVRRELEGAFPLRVPLKTDIHHGANWSEAH